MTQAVELIPAAKLGELPPLKRLVDTHFVECGLNIVYGPSGAYKSFYVLDQALAIAQVMPVVYVAAEGSAGLHGRVAAWCNYHDTDAGELYFVCQEVNLLQLASVNALTKVIKPVNPKNIIFDTLARCLVGGDENSARDTGIAINHCAHMQRELGTAITWIHHSNRAERGERGSGAIRGAADCMIDVSANGDGIIRVSCSKEKDAEPWPTEEYSFEPVGSSGVLLPTDSLDDKVRKLTVREEQVLAFIGLEIFQPSGAQARQIVNALNIPERDIYRLLSHLKRELHICHDSKGDP